MIKTTQLYFILVFIFFQIIANNAFSQNTTIDEYQADSTQNIKTSISYWKDYMPTNSSLYNSHKSKQNKLEYNQTSEQKDFFNLIDFSLNYQKKIKCKVQQLQRLGQYSNNAEKSNYKTNQVNLIGEPYFAENGYNTSKSNNSGFLTYYSHPIDTTGRSIVETGMRYERSSSISDYSVLNNVVNIDTSRTDDMDYFQNIYAAYLSLKFETKNKWVIRPEFRYEVFRLNGNLKRNEASFKALFDNWVPSILIAKNMGEKHEI